MKALHWLTVPDSVPKFSQRIVDGRLERSYSRLGRANRREWRLFLKAVCTKMKHAAIELALLARVICATCALVMAGCNNTDIARCLDADCDRISAKLLPGHDVRAFNGSLILSLRSVSPDGLGGWTVQAMAQSPGSPAMHMGEVRRGAVVRYFAQSSAEDQYDVELSEVAQGSATFLVRRLPQPSTAAAVR
jgi:hypothetical protein